MKTFDEKMVEVLRLVMAVADGGCACDGAKGASRCIGCDARALLKKLKIKRQEKKRVPPSGAPKEVVVRTVIEPDDHVVHSWDDAESRSLGVGHVLKTDRDGLIKVRWHASGGTRIGYHTIDQVSRIWVSKTGEIPVVKRRKPPKEAESRGSVGEKEVLRKVDQSEMASWLTGMVAGAIDDEGIEPWRIVGVAPSHMDELADILDFYGYPETAKKVQAAADEERAQEEREELDRRESDADR